jgi:hypothetical protein
MIVYRYQQSMDLKIDKLIQMMTYVHHVKLFVKIFQVVQINVEINFYHMIIEKNDDDVHEINQLLVMMILTKKIVELY